METIFNFKNYVEYLRAYIKNQPKLGRGLIQKMAKHMNVNATFVSQVLAGSKHFSIEQSFEVSEFLGLQDLEKEYFIQLVQKDRAGSKKSEIYFSNKLDELRKKALKLSHRVEQDKDLTETQKAIFYSSWLYTAIQMYTSIGDGKTLEEIITEFNITRPRATEILGFLLEAGLCDQAGVFYKIGAQSTHLDNRSPFVIRHHMNWRNRALQRHDNIQENELVYTAPMSLSQEDFDKLREELAGWIKKMVKTVKSSPSEEMAFLAIDFLFMTSPK